MKSLCRGGAWLLLLLVLVRPAVGQIQHRFVCIDNGRDRLLCVDQREPAKGWSVSIPSGSRDLQLLDGGRVLVSHGNGAAEYGLSDGRKLDWAVSRYTQVNSAQRIGDTTILAANRGEGIVLYRLGPAGQELGQQVLGGLKDVRLVRPVEQDGWLLTVTKPDRVVQVDADGRVTWQAPLPGKGYKAVRLPSGNTLVSTGGAVSVIELDRQGQVVTSRGTQAAHPDARLLWFSGFDLAANGNLVAANWLGHGKEGQGPHLVEFDRTNRLVWSWEDHQAAQRVTNVLLLDP